MERDFQLVGFASSVRTPGLSVHDFVRIDLPFDAVVGAFLHFVTPAMMSGLVVTSWRDETSELGQVMGRRVSPGELPAVEVRVGRGRSRRDAVIIPISWSTHLGPWVPPVEADLEIVAFGPERTHLHILGQSCLPPDAAPCTDRASIEHRFAVAVVRHLLCSLSAAITDGVSSQTNSDPETNTTSA